MGWQGLGGFHNQSFDADRLSLQQMYHFDENHYIFNDDEY